MGILIRKQILIFGVNENRKALKIVFSLPVFLFSNYLPALQSYPSNNKFIICLNILISASTFFLWFLEYFLLTQLFLQYKFGLFTCEWLLFVYHHLTYWESLSSINVVWIYVHSCQIFQSNLCKIYASTIVTLFLWETFAKNWTGLTWRLIGGNLYFLVYNNIRYWLL